jgi:hypothetical protein
VRLCEPCSSDQASKAQRSEQESQIHRGLMTAGILGFVWGTNGVEGGIGAEGHGGEHGAPEVGGFDAGFGGDGGGGGG